MKPTQPVTMEEALALASRAVRAAPSQEEGAFILRRILEEAGKETRKDIARWNSAIFRAVAVAMMSVGSWTSILSTMNTRNPASLWVDDLRALVRALNNGREGWWQELDLQALLDLHEDAKEQDFAGFSDWWQDERPEAMRALVKRRLESEARYDERERARDYRVHPEGGEP